MAISSMARDTGVRIASVAPQFVERASESKLIDWLAYFEPVIIILSSQEPAPKSVHQLTKLVGSETKLFHPADAQPLGGHRRIGSIDIVFAPTQADLESINSLESTALDSTTPTFVLSDLLALDVNKTRLTTSLVGRQEYVSALEPERLDGSYVHISSRLPAGYRHDWGGVPVIGSGSEAGANGSDLVALDLRTDGEVLTRTHSPSRLGLQALHGVGRHRAETLRNAGFENREAVANGTISALAEIDGIARPTAEQIYRSATAIVNGRVVRTASKPIPIENPLYIDIETDGLDPTIVWLVGVLDGSAENGRYHSFLQKDPTEPGGALRDFLEWYQATASDRPLVAYNGRSFDFQVIREHLIQYAPSYLDQWKTVERFDPYHWAIESENAILPGRTNKLEDVTAALGFERTESTLTGAAVASAYRQWMADQSLQSELAWDRFRSYCETDVRSLAFVFEALEEQSRVVSETGRKSDIETSTTQGALSDW